MDDDGQWLGFRMLVRTSDGVAVHYLAITRSPEEAKEAVWDRLGRRDEIAFIDDQNALARARALHIPNGTAFEDGT